MEMLEEDQPPQEIWLDNDAIENHFAWLKDKRSAGADGSDAPDPDSWSSNEITKGIR